MVYRFIENTNSRKVGAMAVSYSPRQTCPDTCPLKNGKCYGENFPIKLHWDNYSNDLNDNYEKAVDTVVEDLLNNKDFMESDLAKKSVLSHNKDGTLKSTSKAKLKRIAGTIVGNKKAILQAEEKHNWDSNLTETDRYIGSDNQLQDAADHVSDFVKRNGKDAVLLTRQGSRIPFFKEDGTPNRMKYKNKKGEIVEGTIE